MTTTEPQKYARSLHAPISLGTTSDDRFMPRGFLSYFAELPKLVLTEKLDGQTTALLRTASMPVVMLRLPSIRGINLCCNDGSESKMI